jgi:hypothetical protein
MRKWWDTSKGAWGLLTIGVGVGVVLSLISPQVGIPVGVIITLAGIVLVIRAYRDKAKPKEELINNKVETENLIKNRIRPSSWKGLSEAELAQLELAVISMNLHHGHADYDGLIDDQKHGRPLNGLCWRCGKPRFQKGDPLK